MTERMSAQQARALVKARLGRSPQDMLEAAVVLEAWGGVPADAALALGAELMHGDPSERAERWCSTSESPKPEKGIVVEGISLVMAVVAVAAWAAPLSREFGTSVVQVAVMLALPLTLGLQWALRSRYLAFSDGLSRLARDPGFAIITVAVLAAPILVLGLPGAIGALLAATWLAGTILVRRGWGLWYGFAVVMATAAMATGLPPLDPLASVGLITLVAAAVALYTSGSPQHRSPAPHRVVLTALVGAGLGVLLVGDSSVGWGIRGALPAVGLIPSTFGSLWGGYHLWRFHDVVPRALQGAPVGARERALSGPAVRVFSGAIMRLVGSTALASVVLVLGADWIGMTTTAGSLLAGFGCVALVTLVVSLLESLGRLQYALLAVAGAIAAELGVALWTTQPLPGTGLLVSGAVGLLIALPPVIVLFLRPGRLVATRLWIP